MRSNRKSTAQTTCDGDDYCPEYVLSVFFEGITPEQREAKHRAVVTEEGWADIEGRDYCPDHSPVTSPTP